MICFQEEGQKMKWSKCPPLVKEFYKEDPEIKNMDPEAVKKFR